MIIVVQKLNNKKVLIIKIYKPSHGGLVRLFVRIISEGREIKPRRQLEQIIERIGNETRMPTRERPLTRERARSNRTQSQARKV